jgi:hypothetical protein
MPSPETPPVERVIAAAGGPVALSRLWATTYTAIYQFKRKGYLPLERAQDAVRRWPGAATLRELVRPDIAAAMDQGVADAILN